MTVEQQAIHIIEKIGANQANLRRLLEQLGTPLGVIPFVGAGLSVPFGFPGWTVFLMAQAKRAGIDRLLAEMIQRGHYEEAAEALSQGLGTRAFCDAIEDCFGDHNLKGVNVAGAVSLLPRLTSGPVITTNFDHIIEKAFEKQGETFQRVVWGAKVDIFADALQQNRKVLLKIHGDVEDRTDRVLTVTEYRKHYGDPASFDDSAPLLRRLLYRIMTSRNLLFLGCSLNQDRTLAVLKNAAENVPEIAHYAVLQEPSPNELTARARFLSDHGIRPIWYPQGRHDLIEPLLSYLVKQIVQDLGSKRLHILGTHFGSFPATGVPKAGLGNYWATDQNNRILVGPDDTLLGHRSGFFGREAEVQKVMEFLNDDFSSDPGNDSGAMCVVNGPPGIGKTEICREAVKRHLLRCPKHRVYWVDLAEAQNAGGLVARLTEAMGCEQIVSQNDLLQFLSYEVAGLVHLDNLEDILDDKTSVDLLVHLVRTPKVKVLASSRETLPGIARNIPIQPLDLESCVKVFLQQWERSSGKIVDANDEVREFVEKDLGRHPLSVVLVAAQAYQYHSLGSLRKSWQQDALRLAKLPRVKDDHLSSLEISLSRSLAAVGRVSSDAIKVWGLIAMFPNGLSTSAWSARAGKSAQFDKIREALVRLNIVEIDGEGSLRMLPPMRRFILHKAETGDSGLSKNLLAEGAYIHFLAVARDAFNHTSDESHEFTLDNLLSEFPNF